MNGTLFTAVPMVFVGVTTLRAAVLSIQNIFWPLTRTPGKQFQGYLDSGLMVIFILGVVIVVAGAAMIWEDGNAFLPAYIPAPPSWLGGDTI